MIWIPARRNAKTAERFRIKICRRHPFENSLRKVRAVFALASEAMKTKKPIATRGSCTRRMASITPSLILLTASVLLPSADASVLSFTGDLRSDANFISCGFDCVLRPADTGGDYAQWAAASVDFAVPVASTIAITFSYGGGTNGKGAVIAEGGFEPYLSLFDEGGNFVASTDAGTTCPAGAQTNSTTGLCYDVELDGGILAAGTYNIAISAFENMSLAENPGGYLLSDSFTGLAIWLPGRTCIMRST